MLNCKKVTEMCSQEMERDLLLQEQVPLRLHLMLCSDCSNFRKQLRVLRLAMQRYASGDTDSTSSDPPSDR